MSIIRIFQILEECTDSEANALTYDQIAVELSKKGIVLERRAIAANVKILAEEFNNDKDAPFVIKTKKR